jgi:anion-transporting  ArsA/GET3 family ATPase
VDPEQFFAASRLVIVAGKGGVGKTTVTAALARAAAGVGLRVLVIEVEGKSGLASMFGADDLMYDEQVLQAPVDGGRGEVRARTITADLALVDYLHDHGLRRLSGRLARTGVLDVVSTAAPGIEDILVLGKVKQLERSGQFDLLLLDAPAAGHAVTFLQSASGLLDAVAVGPIHAQARDVLEMLTDPTRCQVVLVTLPEETPVNELVDTAYRLEDRVGLSLGPVVVNGCSTDLAGLAVDPADAAAAIGEVLDDDTAGALRRAAAFRRARVELQHEQVGRLAERLPLPQIELPFLFTSALGPAELDVLATALTGGVRALAA